MCIYCKIGLSTLFFRKCKPIRNFYFQKLCVIMLQLKSSFYRNGDIMHSVNDNNMWVLPGVCSHHVSKEMT